MTEYYDIGSLVVVRDPCYDHDVICVVVGIGSAILYDERDNFLYHGYSLTHNNHYYFFDVDIVCHLSGNLLYLT
jgi:hypothetical protein